MGSTLQLITGEEGMMLLEAWSQGHSPERFTNQRVPAVFFFSPNSTASYFQSSRGKTRFGGCDVRVRPRWYLEFP
jgi:hypothetical protein